MFTVKKRYQDLPAAHRQPTHVGHCRLIHGHNFAFEITFGCISLDRNGFVIDVGELGFVKDFLVQTFDHTLLLNESDPFYLHLKQSLQSKGAPIGYPGGIETVSDFAEIVPVPNCGMEGLAEFVFNGVQRMLEERQAKRRGVCVLQVECFEDSKNSATFKP